MFNSVDSNPLSTIYSYCRPEGLAVTNVNMVQAAKMQPSLSLPPYSDPSAATVGLLDSVLTRELLSALGRELGCGQVQAENFSKFLRAAQKVLLCSDTAALKERRRLIRSAYTKHRKCGNAPETAFYSVAKLVIDGSVFLKEQASSDSRLVSEFLTLDPVSVAVQTEKDQKSELSLLSESPIIKNCQDQPNVPTAEFSSFSAKETSNSKMSTNDFEILVKMMQQQQMEMIRMQQDFFLQLQEKSQDQMSKQVDAPVGDNQRRQIRRDDYPPEIHKVELPQLYRSEDLVKFFQHVEIVYLESEIFCREECEDLILDKRVHYSALQKIKNACWRVKHVSALAERLIADNPTISFSKLKQSLVAEFCSPQTMKGTFKRNLERLSFKDVNSSEWFIRECESLHHTVVNIYGKSPSFLCDFKISVMKKLPEEIRLKIIERLNQLSGFRLLTKKGDDWIEDVPFLDTDESLGLSFIAALRAVCAEQTSAKGLESTDFKKKPFFQPWNESQKTHFFKLSEPVENESKPRQMPKNIKDWANDFEALFKVTGKGCTNPQGLLHDFQPCAYVELVPRSSVNGKAASFFVIGYKDASKGSRILSNIDAKVYKVSPWIVDKYTGGSKNGLAASQKTPACRQ